jgi:hypothetical protein
VRDDAVTRSATPATGRRDDHVHVGQVFENFQTHCPDAGDEMRLVSGVNVTKTFCVRDALGFESCFIEVASVQTDFGAEVAHGLKFRLVNVFSGRVDDDARVEEPCGVSDRLSVVSG